MTCSPAKLKPNPRRSRRHPLFFDYTLQTWECAAAIIRPRTSESGQQAFHRYCRAPSWVPGQEPQIRCLPEGPPSGIHQHADGSLLDTTAPSA